MAACRSCGAPIVWAITSRGERIPLNPEPVEEGRFVIEDVEGRRYARPAIGTLDSLGDDLARSLDASCDTNALSLFLGAQQREDIELTSVRPAVVCGAKVDRWTVPAAKAPWDRMVAMNVLV